MGGPSAVVAGAQRFPYNMVTAYWHNVPKISFEPESDLDENRQVAPA